MLTDTKLRNLKPRDKLYKENDRDGLYVAVTKPSLRGIGHSSVETRAKKPLLSERRMRASFKYQTSVRVHLLS